MERGGRDCSAASAGQGPGHASIAAPGASAQVQGHWTPRRSPSAQGQCAGPEGKEGERREWGMAWTRVEVTAVVSHQASPLISAGLKPRTGPRSAQRQRRLGWRKQLRGFKKETDFAPHDVGWLLWFRPPNSLGGRRFVVTLLQRILLLRDHADSPEPCTASSSRAPAPGVLPALPAPAG